MSVTQCDGCRLNDVERDRLKATPLAAGPPGPLCATEPLAAQGAAQAPLRSRVRVERPVGKGRRRAGKGAGALTAGLGKKLGKGG